VARGAITASNEVGDHVAVSRECRGGGNGRGASRRKSAAAFLGDVNEISNGRACFDNDRGPDRCVSPAAVNCGAIRRYQVRRRFGRAHAVSLHRLPASAGAPMVGWAMFAADAVKVTQGRAEDLPIYPNTARRHILRSVRHRAFFTSTDHNLPDHHRYPERDLRRPPCHSGRWRTSRTPSASAGWNARNELRRSSDFRRSK